MKTQLNPLSQSEGDLYLTDGGLETHLIFHKGMELPYFAAYSLLLRESGREHLTEYYRSYVTLALKFSVGLVLETPTWRASSDWGGKLGHDARTLVEVNQRAVAELRELVEKEGAEACTVISGCMGPRGDGYQATELLTPEQAAEYHWAQAQALASAGADQLSAMTLSYSDEAIGFCWAARKAGVPLVISFTVEKDGRLPGGESLAQAVSKVDRATEEYPSYYMVNCAYPTHMEGGFDPEGAWQQRLGGLKPNASSKSHEELNESKELDSGDPSDFAKRCADLRRRFPNLQVFGGCCGTGVEHFKHLARELVGSCP